MIYVRLLLAMTRYLVESQPTDIKKMSVKYHIDLQPRALSVIIPQGIRSSLHLPYHEIHN